MARCNVTKERARTTFILPSNLHDISRDLEGAVATAGWKEPKLVGQTMEREKDGGHALPARRKRLGNMRNSVGIATTINLIGFYIGR